MTVKPEILRGESETDQLSACELVRASASGPLPSRAGDPVEVCLLGASLGTGNRGVSALSASLVKLVTDEHPEAKVTLLIGNSTADPFQLLVNGRKTEVSVVNYRMSPRSALREHLLWIIVMSLVYRLLPIASIRRAIENRVPWIRSAARARLAGEIRGGDSFSDIYGLKKFFMGTLPLLTVIWVRGKVALFPQTYGPFKSPWARMLARYVLKHSSTILARDQDSIEVVQNLSAGRRSAEFCPDVAFMLEAIRPENPQIQPPLPQKPGCLVGLNVNGLMFYGGYNRKNMFELKLDYRQFLIELLPALLAEGSHHILLVPHTFAPPESVESDPGACQEILRTVPKMLTDRIHLVTRPYDQNEIKGIIGLCDFFIGSRMHSCIGALSQGIPTVGVAYSKKFKGVFDSIGVGEWVIDAREHDNLQAVHQTISLFQNRQAMKEHLPKRIQQARSRLREVFEGLLK